MDKERELPEASGLDRRTFLVGGTVVAAVLTACRPPEPGAGRSRGAGDSFEFEEISIAALQEGMSAGRWTCRQITEAYLDRIERIDGQGISLRSVIETNPEAQEIADQLDRERREGRLRGPLHGIPILLKDNIDTHDRMTTTAGSLALEGSIPARDSFVTEQLRRAGALLLGKANLSEWANFRSTRSSSGWSGRGGQCRNPYVLDRNPCGSSSGSGVSVSANLCAAAIGTETDGSIVCPSHANGIVGIKPTVGLVSRTGIIPISFTQDTAGPMARSVRDAATILGILTGTDPQDPHTSASRGNNFADYTRFLDASGLQGARIGVARQFWGFHPAVDAIMEDSLAALSEAGATLADPADISTVDDFADSEFEVMLFEFKFALNAYLSRLPAGGQVRSLADLILFNEKNADREMPHFGQEILVMAEEKGSLESAEYRQALAANQLLSREQGIDRIMNDNQLDAIVAPTGGPAWPTDWVNGDHYLGGSSSPSAVAGYPAITVPAGFVRGLPVGITFFGRAWSEPVLIRLAYAFEQAVQARRPPEFIPTLV